MLRQPFIRPALRRKPPAAKLRVARGAEGDNESMKESQGACNTRRNRPGDNLGTPESNPWVRSWWVDAQSPVERLEEEQRISCREKAFRTGENFFASRR